MLARDPRWLRYIYAINLAVRWRLAYWYTERYAHAGESWREREVLVACGSCGAPDRVIARGGDFMTGADATLEEWDQLQRDMVAASWTHP